MKKQLFRTILMIIGIITVVVVLMSQSFYYPVKKELTKAKKEQKASQPARTKIVHAQPDVVPSSTVQLDENTPTLVKALTSVEIRVKAILPDIKTFASYFKTLFRAFISPNAP